MGRGGGVRQRGVPCVQASECNSRCISRGRIRHSATRAHKHVCNVRSGPNATTFTIGFATKSPATPAAPAAASTVAAAVGDGSGTAAGCAALAANASTKPGCSAASAAKLLMALTAELGA